MLEVQTTCQFTNFCLKMTRNARRTYCDRSQQLLVDRATIHGVRGKRVMHKLHVSLCIERLTNKKE
jgi:hypothetical protein